MSLPITDRDFIRAAAAEKEAENDAFRTFAQRIDGDELDAIVHRLNDEITPQIDCTTCGGCCQQLMINVTEPETVSVAEHLNMPVNDFKEKFVEEGFSGRMIMNTIPCNFLSEKKCSIYEHRFHECREFPSLHLDNFKGRLFASLIHYAMCPIIYNVVEELKIETQFLKREV